MSQKNLLAALLVLLVAACPALAGSGGNVLPSSAHPKGYSLSDAARATAVYNVGPRDTAQPNWPFYLLADDATVKPGTSLYIPIFYADDSGVVDPAPFPTDLNDQDAIADYIIDSVNAFIHAHGVPASVEITQFFIEVDGKDTVLDDSYVSGVTTAPLPDGQPAGTHYIVSGAFLTPLTPGQHTVGIGGIIDGEPVVFFDYAVNVSK
jgi:hypothetical protein